MLDDLAEAGNDPVDHRLDDHSFPFADGVQHFRDPIGSDEHRDEGKPPGKLSIPKRETRNGMNAVVTHRV